MLKDEILRLHALGKSYSEIKEELKCSKGTISYYLGAGQKEKTLSRQRDRRSKTRKAIQDAKSNAVCADCKEDYPYWIMQFDHLNDKLFTIAQATVEGRSLDTVLKEIEKCDIVCANCHANRTHMRLVQSGSDTPILNY